MPKFLIKCSFEKLYVAEIDSEIPEDEDELGIFMEQYEDENEVDWIEQKTFSEFSGREI
jgi:hypothetical protein